MNRQGESEPVDYLWFGVEILAEPHGIECAELDVLRHRLLGPYQHRETLELHPVHLDGRWALRSRVATPEHVRESPSRLGATPLAIAEVAYAMVHGRLMSHAHKEGFSRLHAAVVDLQGARILVAAPSGTGKTTLALRLIGAGGVVHSDEGALIRDGRSIGLPRRAHVKDSGTELLPPSWQDHRLTLGYHPPIHTLDLCDLNSGPGPTRLTEAGTDLVVLLGARQARHTITSVAAGDALWELLGEADHYGSEVETLTDSRSRLMSELSTLLRGTPVVRLEGHGDPAVGEHLARLL